MAERRDEYSGKPEWEEEIPEEKIVEQPQGYTYSEQQPYQDSIHTAPIDQQPLPQQKILTPEEEAKKKKRKRIYIIVFAIVLPAVLLLAGLGFLIWGLVVGFTTCIDSCGQCCEECCSCFGTCESCGNCCTGCTDDCSNCCTDCDDCMSCCGSESTIRKAIITPKMRFQHALHLLKWYIYKFVDLIQAIFMR